MLKPRIVPLLAALVVSCAAPEAEGTSSSALQSESGSKPASIARNAVQTLAAATQPMTAESREKIDEILASLSSTDTPGCAVSVLQANELTFARGYGMASLETGMPIDARTVFYAGSVSKQFAAAAVLLAANENLLSLEDSLRKWFPELPEYANDITVSHLVHHTSGLRDYLGLMSLAGIAFETPMTPSQVLRLIARQKELNFAPGTEYLYSNSGYFLLAQLVGRASESSLREYAHKRMFEPLGMTDTHFHDDRLHVVKRRAAAYAPSHGHAEGFRVLWSPAFDQVGSGGLLTTVEDLTRWEMAASTNALGAEFWPQMLEVGKLKSGDELDYAFGVTRDRYRGADRVQHGGAMFGYRAALVRYPELETSIALLCNLSSAAPSDMADRIADVVLEDSLGMMRKSSDARTRPPERARVAWEASKLDLWQGTFFSAELAAHYRITTSDGRPMIQINDLDPEPLLTFEDGTAGFGRRPGATIRSEQSEDERVSSFRLDAGRVQNLLFERQD